MTIISVATWNVERVTERSWKKLPAQRTAITAVDAGVWVLTETSTWFEPVKDFHAVHCPPRDGHGPGERMVSIWSRWPLTLTGVEPRARGAVSAVADTPAGPLTIFGSVIPYAHDRGPEGTSRLWQEHYREIERLADEWRDLAERGPLIVAGDLNQDRDGSRVYGTHEGRAMLTEAFAGAGLTCHTEADMVAAGYLRANHLIDHIATTADLSASDLRCWEPVDADDTRMSDHPGVAVTVQTAM